MLKDKLVSAAFAIVVGIVLGVTVWSVSVRSGGLMRVESPAIERAMEEAVLPQDDETKAMIERGELSDHPARFWRRGDGEGRRRRRREDR